MKFLIILCILAAVQIVISEIPSKKTTPPATNSEVIGKNKIKEEITPTAAAKAISSTAPTQIKAYDDGVLKSNISDLNRRQFQQDLLLKQLLQDAAFIKKSLIKIINQNTDWTVIQRRQDGSVDFFRTWAEYKDGFGNRQGEFFIGLQNLYEMTAEGDPQELLIILEDFESETRYAKYDTFKIGNEDEKYFIKELGEYSGDAGDSLSYHKGKKFSTKDQDNDNNATSNCAVDFKAGWWFDRCYSSNLNGPYYKGARACRGGINWYHWHNYMYSLKSVEMMIRPCPPEGE